jgi:hypothetical protein
MHDQQIVCTPLEPKTLKIRCGCEGGEGSIDPGQPVCHSWV